MKKQKNKTIESLRINSKDVGSSEVQIGLLNDKHSTTGLLKAVNRRKVLLKYLKRKNPESYAKILTKLNLRK